MSCPYPSHRPRPKSDAAGDHTGQCPAPDALGPGTTLLARARLRLARGGPPAAVRCPASAGPGVTALPLAYGLPTTPRAGARTARGQTAQGRAERGLLSAGTI